LPKSFEGHGLALTYPDNWSVETSETDGDWSVQLQSPGTAYVQVIGQPRARGTPAGVACRAMLEATLAALREDYPDLETEPAEERIAGRGAEGLDVRFISLDLSVTCWLRAVALPAQTLLILCQASDLELRVAEPVFQAIRASIRLRNGV
jgi:hypothetical protein